jgi:xanthine dehydrogenase accessory factor
LSNIVRRIGSASKTAGKPALIDAQPLLYNRSGGWLRIVIEAIANGGAVVRAMLIGVKGSAPREVGATMLITADDIYQTIGGGALEFDVMASARAWMSSNDNLDMRWQRQVISVALGPDIGQCCGGHVRVLLELFTMGERDALEDLAASAPSLIAHPVQSGAALKAVDQGNAHYKAQDNVQPGLSADGSIFIASPDRRKRALFLYGAGHVGRALVGHLMALEYDVHWVDIAQDRFPAETSDGACRVIASDPTIIARHAPNGAIHLVLTHDHALDQAICHSLLLQSNFARLGLIGSATKAARFRRALAKAGIADDQLDRLVCPVGLQEITGKQPAHIALSIAVGITLWQQELDAEVNTKFVGQNAARSEA